MVNPIFREKGAYSNLVRNTFVEAMSDLIKRYKTVKALYPHTYFAGANTAQGFVPAYPTFIREAELDRLYIIKGGSGTGKSSVIRACASEAARQGAEVTLLLCSSDPSSADAAVMHTPDGRSAAVLDGTAPHTLDPEYPGAAGEIVDVGQYWNGAVLRERRDEIAALTAKKRSAYARAYRFLGAYRQLSEVRRSMISACMDMEKAESAASRLAASFPHDKVITETAMYTYALSMTGAWRLDTFTRAADREIRVCDFYGSGEIFLGMIRRAAAERCTLRISPSPAWSEMLSEIYIPSAGTVLALSERRPEEECEHVRCVNMQRFVRRDVLAQCRAKLRFTQRCREEMFDGALEALEDARRAHFALEAVYRDAMHFDGVAEETERICREIGELLG